MTGAAVVARRSLPGMNTRALVPEDLQRRHRGIHFERAIDAAVRASLDATKVGAVAIAKKLWPADQVTPLLLRAAVSPGQGDKLETAFFKCAPQLGDVDPVIGWKVVGTNMHELLRDLPASLNRQELARVHHQRTALRNPTPRLSPARARSSAGTSAPATVAITTAW